MTKFDELEVESEGTGTQVSPLQRPSSLRSHPKISFTSLFLTHGLLLTQETSTTEV